MQLSKILSIIASAVLILSPLSAQAAHIVNAGTADYNIDCSSGSMQVTLSWGNFTEFGEPYQWGIHRNNVQISSSPQRTSSGLSYTDTNPLADGISVNEYEIVGTLFGGSGGGDHFYTYAASVTLVCPPTNATLNITPDRYMSWNVAGDPNLCSIAACSGSSSVSYNFNASGEPSHTVSAYAASANVVGYSISPLKRLTSKLFNFVTASTGSGATCNSTPGGSCNFNLNTTYCTVNVVGYWNGSGNIPTNASYSISGASNASGTNSSGTNSHTLIADSSGSSYTFNSSGFTGTVNGYSSDIYSSSSSQTCFPGSTITFNITSQSKPILDVR